MRQPHSTLTPAIVRRTAQAVLQQALAWQPTDSASRSRAVAAARQVRRWYRRRFGIETSYRQLHECQGRTTAKEVAYRLLLVGLALLLRQVGVWLARAGGRSPGGWVGELTLGRLLGWLAEALRRRYRERLAIDLDQPLPFPEELDC